MVSIGRGIAARFAREGARVVVNDVGFVTGQNFEVDGGMLVPGRSAPAELGPVYTPENIGDY